MGQSVPRILVTIPNLGWIRTDLVSVIAEILVDPRYKVTFDLPQRIPLENSHAHTAKKVRSEKFDYWLNIDDDTIPTRNPLDLVDLDKDVIGLPTPVWGDAAKVAATWLHYNTYTADPDEPGQHLQHRNKRGLQRVDAVGGGCFLIANRVLWHPTIVKEGFARIYGPDGCAIMGTDLAFCKRVREAGFEIWTHYDYLCGHIKEIDLGTVYFTMNAIAAGAANESRPEEEGVEAATPRPEHLCAEAR